jgi:hypothetical protein
MRACAVEVNYGVLFSEVTQTGNLLAASGGRGFMLLKVAINEE